MSLITGQSSMTKIYIDTNIILNESYFRSAFSQAFLNACSLLQIDVVIPDIVLDEVLGNYPKKLKSKAKEFQKAQKEIGRLVDIDEIDISIDQAISDYEDFLSDLIEENGIHVAPYPDISLQDLVVKSYELEKPFKDSGEGHKDFLVWKSIKAHTEVEAASPPHFFLTNNTKDFATLDQDKEHVLHPDLAAQIDVAAHQPALLTALRDAWEKLLAPKLEGMTAEDIPDLSDDDIKQATSDFLLDDLPDRTAFGFENLPFSNDVSISAVGSDEISEITFTKVGGEVIIKVVGTVEIEVTGFIEKFAYYQGTEDQSTVGIAIIDSDWNDHVMLVGSTIETAFELSIFYSLEQQKIVGKEIALPQEIEDDWYY
jgi:rRNA-processing protein FCF1